MNLSLTPGMKTSEFLLTIAANVIAVLDYAKVWNIAPHSQMLALQAIITAAYSLSRGWAKSSSGINPADVPVFAPPAPPPAPSPTVTAPAPQQPPAS